MLKYLVVVGVIAFVYFIFIKKKPLKKGKKTTKEDKTQDEMQNEMVECERCGIYCELDDTIISNNHYYCSNECIKES